MNRIIFSPTMNRLPQQPSSPQTGHRPARLRFACLFTALISPIPALGLDSDSSQPIRIQADAAMVDENKGTSIYKGEVVIRQGTLKITADEVEILTANNEVQQIVAHTDKNSDRLAHYQQEVNESGDKVIADARSITYLPQEERLHLAGNAQLTQAGDKFEGELLYYDIPRGIVNLNSGGGSDRVNMTITPKQSNQ